MAYTPISDWGWSVPWMVIQPEGNGILMMQQFPQTPKCDARMGKQGIVLFEPAKNRVSQQEIPFGMAFTGWDTGGFVQLSDPEGKAFQMSIYDGTITPPRFPPQEEANFALWNFLRALAGGAQDPSQYAKAAARFGGDWSVLAEQFPEVDPADGAGLLQKTCELGGYICLPAQKIETVQERNGFHFSVVYRQSEGQDLSLDGQTRFSFHVQQGADGKYRVMTLPPRAQAADALRSFLDLLAADRDDAYTKAAGLFAGSPRAFHSYYPPPTPSDPAAFLRWACTDESATSSGPHRCGTPRALSPFEQLSPDRVRIWVQFSMPDGAAWAALNTQAWFPFSLLRGTDGQWRAADLPPSEQGFGNMPAPLPDAESAGLDDAGILTALWQDYMEMHKSALLPEGQRLAEYEIGGVNLDPRLANLIDEFKLDAVATVNYSVRPVKLEYSSWVAGNGTIGEDGWVRNKMLIIGLVRENGASHLRIMGTGP